MSACQHVSSLACQHISISSHCSIAPLPHRPIASSPHRSITPSPSDIQSHHPSLLILLLTILLTIGCRSQDNSFDLIAERGTLRVGLDPTYPPFEFDDGSSLQGIDIDLANAIGEELGVSIEFVWFGYDGLYDALGTRQVDVLISGMVIIPERQRDFAYSDPYFNAGELLVVREGETAVSAMRDLNGRSLAVELGAQGHVEATVWQKNLGDLTILPQETGDAALTAVLDSQADAALVDSITARLFLGRNVGLTAVANPVTVDPFVIVVNVEDEQLLDKLNESLESVTVSGQLTQIFAKWFK
ncbi:MAG: transporter substrate-binding domain-containing protein [Chloroflexota bacterium]